MKTIISRIAWSATQVIIVLLAVAAIGTAASAHAVLVSSVPKDKAVLKTPPKQVVLRFDARIEKRVSQVTLLDAKNKKVKLPASKNAGGKPSELIVAMPALKPGTYRIQYQVMATDGHLTPGQVQFTVAARKKP